MSASEATGTHERAERPCAQKAFADRRTAGLLLALVVVLFTLGPVVYGALGGFRSNEQLARDPAGLPDPGCWPTTRR